MCGVFRARLDPCGFQHIGERDTGPLGAARAAVGPLIAARRRREAGAAVAAAFQHHAPRHRLVFRFQLAERDFDLVVDLAIDGDLPGIGIPCLLGDLPVVADVEFLDRRGVVVEQAFRRLGDQRLFTENDEPFVLAGIFQILRSLRLGGCGSAAGLRVGAGNAWAVAG